MLAAGGVLGLLLMGAAVGGLMAGVETPARGDADDEPGPDPLRDGDDAPPDDIQGATWTGDFAPDGGLRADAPPDMPASALAHLLFGEGAARPGGLADGAPIVGPGTGSGAGPEDDQDNIFAALDASLDASLDEDGVSPPDAPEQATGGGDADLHDITDTTPFSGGPDIPLVSDFKSDTDRLILDFDGTEDMVPDISIDLETSPGDAVVRSNGVGVVFVEGATGLTVDHVDIVMSGIAEPSEAHDPTPGQDVGHATPADGTTGADGDEAPPETDRPEGVPGLPGDTASGANGPEDVLSGTPGSQSGLLGRITDFDRDADLIELVYDPEQVEDPTVDVVGFPDGTGATILLNGAPILDVVGAQGLDPAEVVLTPSEDPMAASSGPA
jgi:hypothetical protein